MSNKKLEQTYANKFVNIEDVNASFFEFIISDIKNVSGMVKFQEYCSNIMFSMIF